MTPAQELSVRLAKDPRPAKPRLRHRDRSRFVCRMKEVREGLGLSVRAVALALGKDPGMVHDIENGAGVQLQTAFQLAQFYGLTIEELWTPIKKT